MIKQLTKIKSLTRPASLKSAVKFKSWNKFTPGFKLNKNSRAGVFLNKKNAPQAFIFDTWSLLDILSEIDDALLDKLSDADYYSKAVNPAGWLIDAIETKLPLANEFTESLKQEVTKAKNGETVSWNQVRKLLQI